MIIAVIGVLIAGVFAYNVYAAIFGANTAFENEEAHLYIETDATFAQVKEDIAPLLERIEDFENVAQKKGYVSNIKPGHYIIKKGMSSNDIINTIRSKNMPIKVAFNNQERLEDLAGRIANQIEADSVSLAQAFLNPDYLKANGFTTETALTMYIPNSYELYWNTDAIAFRNKMNKEYNRFWNTSRQAKAKKINLSQAEVYTLASIVQKETAKIDERPRVAGVYMNRLKRNIKLDADPTVIYAVKKEKGDFNTVIKRVLYKDLEVSSPYNTYRNRGLPPGPIFMPDVTAIDAVLNYEKHDYYYFVANIEKMGYHKFAKSLSQHNANAVAYRNWIARQGIRR